MEKETQNAATTPGRQRLDPSAPTPGTWRAVFDPTGSCNIVAYNADGTGLSVARGIREADARLICEMHEVPRTTATEKEAFYFANCQYGCQDFKRYGSCVHTREAWVTRGL